MNDILPLPRFLWRDAPGDPAAAARLAAALSLPSPVAALLAARGIRDPEAARRFLSPALRDLGDPLAFPGMAAAAECVSRAIAAGDTIVVFGDFDADGVGAAAILVGFLRAMGARASVFLPDRLSEGYGLTPPAWERCKAEHPGLRLLVTVDCGIASAPEIAAIRAEGVEVVVTDHHAPAPELPRSCAIVNPRLGATPGAENLCGAGVAFKLAHAILKRERQRRGPAATDPDLRHWLDILAVSTIADIVPLTGENRILACGGLHRLRTEPCRGLFALMDRASLPPEEVGGANVAFRLCPRINAAGRLGSARDAYDLLVESDPDRARELAIRLNGLNAERHTIEQNVLEAALAGLEERGFDPGREGAVVADGGPDWHPGVLGIVAARLADRFRRPAAVIAFDDDGNGRGSLRAGEAGDYDVLSALSSCRTFLVRFGGHRKAGGVSLRREDIGRFRERFSAACREQAGPAPAALPALSIDGWLDPADATLDLTRQIARLEPFGEGNPEPVWAMRGVSFAQPPRAVGTDGAHLQVFLKKDGTTLSSIGFGLGGLLPAVLDAMETHSAFDVAGTLQANIFNGRPRVQLLLRDVRTAAP